MSQSKLYIQKYIKAWESKPEFKDWFKKPFIEDDKWAYCLHLKAKPSVIKTHDNTNYKTLFNSKICGFDRV